MKIGIIGSGNIGGTLRKHWAAAGHEVMFSSRHPEELESMAKQANAQVGTITEAANFSDVILLAIPFGKIPDVTKQIGTLPNKILIDATNPYPQRDGEMAQQVIDDPTQTATGFVATQFAGTPVVKAFNSIYYKVLEEQAFQSGGDRVAVQVASDDPQAKEIVMQLIEQIGFAPQDIGDLQSSTIFEPNAPLYNKNLKIEEAETQLSHFSA
jgi:8-hydroxy-5-deazaflavin:NADPH oxidoreductase